MPKNSLNTFYKQLKHVTVAQIIAYIIVIFAICVVIRIIWEKTNESFNSNLNTDASKMQCNPHLRVNDIGYNLSC